MSKRKPNRRHAGGPPPAAEPPAPPDPDAPPREGQGNPDIQISSCAPLPGDAAADAMCRIDWDGVQLYAAPEAVRACASDLYDAAAFAECMAVLSQMGLPDEQLQRFVGDMVNRSRTGPLGNKDTLILTPGLGRSSAGTITGMVLVARGSKTGAYSTVAARQVALVWLSAAEAAEGDALLTEALDAVLHSSPEAHQRVLNYMGELRADPNAYLHRVYAEEQERMDALAGKEADPHQPEPEPAQQDGPGAEPQGPQP